MKMAFSGIRGAILRLHRHSISFVEEIQDSTQDLLEPETLLEIDYESDLQVEVVRCVQETIIISSEEGAFSIRVNFSSHEVRDLATLLIRNRQLEFNSDQTVNKKELSQKDLYTRKENKWNKELESLRTKLDQAEQKVTDYAELQTQLEEAESTIVGLHKSLEDYVDLHKVNEKEIKQLKTEVDYYRKERISNETESLKLATMFAKLKNKYIKLLQDAKIQEQIDIQEYIQRLGEENKELQDKVKSLQESVAAAS